MAKRETTVEDVKQDAGEVVDKIWEAYKKMEGIKLTFWDVCCLIVANKYKIEDGLLIQKEK